MGMYMLEYFSGSPWKVSPFQVDKQPPQTLCMCIYECDFVILYIEEAFKKSEFNL